MQDLTKLTPAFDDDEPEPIEEPEPPYEIKE